VACRGYALRLERALRVVENRLVVQSRLENVGERPFTVDEYCHNFVAPGGRQTQKGLRLVFPFEPVLEGAKALLPFEVAGRELQFDGAVSRGRGFHTHVSNGCSNPSGTSRFNGARWWELISADGARMRETVSEPWKRFAFWGAPHVVSPEVFVEFDLNAGMQVQWTRTFEFSV
jgi:hypothetical protein